MIKKCDRGCKHDFQDRQYGPGIRVHTEPIKGDPRCTVCSESTLIRRMRSIINSPSWNPACALKSTKVKVLPGGVISVAA